MRARLGTLGWVFLALIFLTDAEAAWVSFNACGFKVSEAPKIEGEIYARAPNIVSIWVKAETVTSVYTFKIRQGDVDCTHLRLISGHEVVVMGTPESVLKKLRGN